PFHISSLTLFMDPAANTIYTLSLHDALPIFFFMNHQLFIFGIQIESQKKYKTKDTHGDVLLLESYDSLYHQAIEFAAVSHVHGTKSIVVLADILQFCKNIFSNKPATANLNPVDGRFGTIMHLAVHLIVPTGHIEVFRSPEPVHHIGAYLVPFAVFDFISSFAFALLQVAEEFKTAYFHKRVKHHSSNVVGLAGVKPSGGKVGSGSSSYRFHDQIIPGTGSIACIKRVSTGASGMINRTCQAKSYIFLHLLVVPQFPDKGQFPIIRIGNPALDLAPGD